MNDDIKQNIKDRNTWIRGLYMILFLVFYSLAEIIIFTIIAFQFILSLLTGKVNDKLVKLGQSFSTYQYQVLIFLTFNSEQHPYPFGAWPKGAPSAKKAAKTIKSDNKEE